MRCSRTPPKETKVCPVCDASIDADARNCPSCLTDLSLFDLGGDSVDVHVSEGKNIDDILASIMEGRTDQPEIFETLKNVATSHPASKDLLVEAKKKAPPAAPPREEPDDQFLCPVCNTVVHGSDTVCPGCGAEFSEGESTEYECPVCKAAVPSDAGQCPSCGVHFASEEGATPATEESAPPPHLEEEPIMEREPPKPVAPPRAPASLITVASSPKPSRIGFRPRLQAVRESRRSAEPDLPQGDPKLIARELPKLVNDVKPLLVSAKRIGLDIEAGKRFINDAVQAGKRRDIAKAVRFIADARKSLDVAFVEFIGGRMETFATELDKAQASAASPPRQYLDDALAKLEKRDYGGAWDTLQSATQAFQSQAKEYNEARNVLDSDARLLGEVRSLGMDVREIDRLSKQGRDAMDRKDFQGALRLAKQAHDRLLRDVPSFMQKQMHEARNTLLDLKIRGGDLSKPVGIVKEASLAEKNEDWLEAIRFVKEFYKSIGKFGKS
ncbi:MAG: zinc ribbon domain-containing protein [Candidatus Thermoplasmatota archaeon]